MNWGYVKLKRRNVGKCVCMASNDVPDIYCPKCEGTGTPKKNKGSK